MSTLAIYWIVVCCVLVVGGAGVAYMIATEPRRVKFRFKGDDRFNKRMLLKDVYGKVYVVEDAWYDQENDETIVIASPHPTMSK